MDVETLNEIGLRADAMPESQARADLHALLNRIMELEDERAATQRRAVDLRRQAEEAVAAAVRAFPIESEYEAVAMVLGHPATVGMQKLPDGGGYAYTYRRSERTIWQVYAGTPMELLHVALVALAQGCVPNGWRWELDAPRPGEEDS